jgi:hypothetical protein
MSTTLMGSSLQSLRAPNQGDKRVSMLCVYLSWFVLLESSTRLRKHDKRYLELEPSFVSKVCQVVSENSSATVPQPLVLLRVEVPRWRLMQVYCTLHVIHPFMKGI